ncbi:MAG: hypothetical protein KAU48_03725 [Candidatus Thorarchaeota archaeon]|nr:hypothetical protein [Candidatus Thorarchaeota archaeon]
MDVSTNDEQSDYECIEFDTPRPDRHQIYIFLIHVLAGVIISVLSLSDGMQSWIVGTGALTPILLGTTGIFYGMHIGINWYRKEMVPHMSRTFMVPEFETDRFLKYIQTRRLTFLIAGYLSIIITQFVWSFIANFVSAFTEYSNVFDVLQVVFLIFIIMILLYLALWLFWTGVSSRIIKSKFSDVSQLIEFEENWQKATKNAQEN